MPRKKIKHNRETCFRCRLHELYLELYQQNEPEFILVALAEAAGSIASALSHDDLICFMIKVAQVYDEDKDTPESNTQH